MTVPDDETSDHILKAISECVDGIVTGYVMLCTFMDDEGERRIYCDTMPDQRCHETIGLLGFGQAIESRRAVKEWESDE